VEDIMQKLELTWIGKGKEPLLEPRILIYDKEKSYGDENTENMLIHGDNLLALKALEQDYTGQIKCIYIDPPYNINVANPNYDDNLPHSDWLSLMQLRLKSLYTLLSDDGFIFIQIDDDEHAYLKVLCDEIFGRNNFVNSIAVKMSEASGNKMAHVNKRLVKIKENILLYRKNRSLLNPIKVAKDGWDSEYRNVFVNLKREDKEFIDSVLACDENSCIESHILKIDEILSSLEVKGIKEVMRDEHVDINNNAVVDKWLKENAYRIFRTAASKSVKKLADEKRKMTDNTYFSVISARDKKVYIVKSDYQLTSSSPRVQVLFAEDYLSTYIGDLWIDIATTGLEVEGGVSFKNSKKPEKLIERIIRLGSNEGDFILDSFLGSGTTAAVAHKMGRKWIGIELGDHCYTHCKPRLERVIDGEDKGGITKSVNWKGGGGFKFYELAPSLLKKDFLGQYVIDREKYDDEMLAMAVAKINGYKYAPDSECFFKQGKATEQSYIFTTTNYVTAEYLSMIENELKENEYLLLCCSAYDVGLADKYDNIFLKKIPLSVLDKCEFGKDNYNLNIVEWDDFEFEVEEDEE